MFANIIKALKLDTLTSPADRAAKLRGQIESHTSNIATLESRREELRSKVAASVNGAQLSVASELAGVDSSIAIISAAREEVSRMLAEEEKNVQAEQRVELARQCRADRDSLIARGAAAAATAGAAIDELKRLGLSLQVVTEWIFNASSPNQTPEDHAAIDARLRQLSELGATDAEMRAHLPGIRRGTQAHLIELREVIPHLPRLKAIASKSLGKLSGFDVEEALRNEAEQKAKAQVAAIEREAKKTIERERWHAAIIKLAQSLRGKTVDLSTYSLAANVLFELSALKSEEKALWLIDACNDFSSNHHQKHGALPAARRDRHQLAAAVGLSLLPL